LTQSGKLTPEVRAVAVVVIIGAIMSILDTTIVNVALQTLASDLHAPLSTIQWVATAYLLSLATVIPLTGWAAEKFGPKRVWMTAVSGFVLTSALCGLAWSAESLIAFRVLQGLAGGMIMPIGMITLAQAAGPSRMGQVMSVVGVPMLLAPVFGPVIGGLLVSEASWRWIFFVNLPIGILGLALATRLMPAAKAEGRSEGAAVLDIRGLLMLSPGVALIVYGLAETAQKGDLSHPSALGPLLVGAALIIAFVRHAWGHPHPLVDVRLMRKGGFAAAAVTIILVAAAFFGGMLLLPLYYQLDRGLSALQAGLLLAPQGIGAAIAMRYAGRATDRIGGGRVVLVGLLVLTVGTLPFTQVDASTSYWLLCVGLFLRGIGLGCTMMPAMASAYALLERSQVPRATPMLNVLQRVGGAVGTAVLAVVLTERLQSALPGAGAEGASSASALPESARERLAEPIASAFAYTYWWALGLSLIAVLPAVLLARSQRREEPAARPSAREPEGALPGAA
jgi:EmrB/QacA subfamily drug resistance transporter